MENKIFISTTTTFNFEVITIGMFYLKVVRSYMDIERGSATYVPAGKTWSLVEEVLEIVVTKLFIVTNFAGFFHCSHDELQYQQLSQGADLQLLVTC